MFTKIVMLFALATVMLLQGCLKEKSFPQDERIDGVVRIFMHEPGRYTVLKRSSAESPNEGSRYLSVQDIDGAGWNHGKSGSGQTVVVQ